MNAAAIKLVVKLWPDHMPEHPNEMDGWKAYSFSRRHGNYKHPTDIGFIEEDGTVEPDEDLKVKLDSGLAFLLSYYEHGNCLWALSGEAPRDRWDSVDFAGLLIWEHAEEDIGAKSYEDREKDARAFIERFTAWCNGHIYGFTIEAFSKCPTCDQHKELDQEDVDGPTLDSCGGYYGDDVKAMVENIREAIGSDPETYEIVFKDEMGGFLADECERLWKEG